MPSTTRRHHARHLLRLLPLAAICVLAILIAPATVFGDPSPAPDPSPEATQSYIVVLKDSVNHPGRVAQRHAINLDADLDNVYKTALEGYSAEMTLTDKEAVERDPNVDYVVPDAKAEAFSQEIPTGVRRAFVPQNSTLDPGGATPVTVNVDVAVIDSGIDYDHPDLWVFKRANCKTPENLCVANAGDDEAGHGSHVAGIIGARDNDIGVVGVAPGARLWAAKVLDKNGAGSIADVIVGVDWVTAHAGQIEVANMSLGCRAYATKKDPDCEKSSVALQEAIDSAIDAGVVVVVAASNDSRPVESSVEGVGTAYPAAFPEVITVSSLSDFDGLPGGLGEASCAGVRVPEEDRFPLEIDDSLSGFSNNGTVVDLTAPGDCIRSAYKHGGYKRLSGTSMATPHVSGAAAILAVEENPSNWGDVMDIRDTLVEEGNFDWTDDEEAFPDGELEPLLDVSDDSVFDLPTPGDVGNVGAVSDETNDLDVFARSGENEIWRKSYREAKWNNWSEIAGPNSEAIVGAPAAISRRDGSTDLFVRGASGGIGFRNKWQETWSSWYPIYPPDNKAILGSPAATARPDIYDGLTMVVRGHDGNVYLKNYWESIPGGWSSWENLGAPAAGTASSPAITMHDETWLHLTVRGADGAIYGKAWGKAEQKWSSWVNLGSGFTSAPAMATSRSGDEMYLFARKADNALWMRKAVAGVVGWSPWESLGGYVTADPAATSRESHGVSVFAALGDQRVYERRFLYGGWTEWMSIDDACPPGECQWHEGGPGSMKMANVEANDLVAIDSEGTANVFSGYEEGFDLEDPTKSLEGELDPALLDGKGHYVVDVADVNDDDNSDLITVKDDGRVLVHLGTEERTFEEATDTGISLPSAMSGAGPNEPVAVADVTGDGFDDLVVFIGPANGHLAVYKGSVEGEFSTDPVLSQGGSVNSALLDGAGSYFLDVADVTGDEYADLVAMNSNGTTHLYKGSAEGKFGSAVSAASINPIMDDGSGQEPVGLGDVSGDGLVDLLTLDGETLKLRAGKTDGTFATATEPYEGDVDSGLLDGSGEELIGLLDHDADGYADLVSLGEDGSLATYAGSGGSFDEPVAQEGEIASVASDEEDGHELLLQKPLLKRPGCTASGCEWQLPEAAEAGWSTTPVSTPSSGLDAIACASSYECFAVGSKLRSSGVRNLLIRRWDGSWSAEKTIPVESDLSGISCTSGEECTAVGRIEAFSVNRAYALRWNGMSWAAQLLPLPSGATFSQLSAVSCTGASACTAAGDYVDSSGTRKTLAATWNGSAWTIQTTPNPSGATASILAGISCASGSACTAVGDYVDSSGTRKTLAMSWNGTAWAIKTTPNPSGAAASALEGVSCPSASECLAVGTYLESSPQIPGAEISLVQSWNGSAWSDQEAPGTSAYWENELNDVTCLASTAECLVVGSTLGSEEEAQPWVSSWDGSSWSEHFVDEEAAGHRAVELAGVSCLSFEECFAVGSHSPVGNARQFGAYHFAGTGNSWGPADSGSSDFHLNDVSCTAVDHCLAAGEFNDGGMGTETVVKEWDGTSWAALPAFPIDSGSDLNGVACADSSMCVVVGDGYGAMAQRRIGSVWASQSFGTPPSGSGLTGVSCPTATSCHAVGWYPGSGGTQTPISEVWTGSGSTWALKTMPTPSGYTNVSYGAVSCTSAALCVSVGTGKTGGVFKPLVARWNGTAWSSDTLPSLSGTLTDVSCASSLACTAVGQAGTGTTATPLILRWDGLSWLSEAAPSEIEYASLDAVSCTPASCLVAGQSYPGGSWSNRENLTLEGRLTAWSVLSSPFDFEYVGGLSCVSEGCALVGRDYRSDTGTNEPFAVLRVVE